MKQKTPTEDIVDIDPEKYHSLLVQILNQSISDYVRLQHPCMRTRVYLQEAFLTSVDFFFDETFCMENLKDEWNKPMSVKSLLSELLNTPNPDIKALQRYVINKCNNYWTKKNMPVLDHIPDTVTIGGIVFDVLHSDTVIDYEYSIEQNYLALNRANDVNNGQLFFEALVQIIKDLFYNEINEASFGVTFEERATIIIARELYLTFKISNCFAYVGTPEASKLFIDLDDNVEEL